MEAVLLQPEDPRWSAALARLPHDAYHLPGYVALCARREGGEAVAVLVEEGAGTLFIPLVLQPLPAHDLPVAAHCDAISPYGYPGPLAREGEEEGFIARALDAVIATLAARGVVSLFVRMHPVLSPSPTMFAGLGDLVRHGRCVMIDFAKDSAVQWSQLRANHRRGIDRARKEGQEIVFDEGWDHLDVFVEAYRETMRRVDADPGYQFERGYFAELRRCMGNDIHLVLARARGRIMGGAIIFTVGGIAQYHLGATFDEFLSHHPHKLLFHQAIDWCRRRGCRLLNLGGGVGGAEDSVFHFKAGFSPDRRDFHTWRVVVDAGMYRELLQGIARPETNSFFPSYRRRTEA